MLRRRKEPDGLSVQPKLAFFRAAIPIGDPFIHETAKGDRTAEWASLYLPARLQFLQHDRLEGGSAQALQPIAEC